MSAALKLDQPRRLTPAEFLAMEAQSSVKHEYCNGRVVEMAGGSIRHSRIVGNVYRFIDEQLDSTPCFALESNALVKIEAIKSYRYPDVQVVCDGVEYEDETRRVVLNPKVVIEVMSPSTANVDLGEKLNEYRQIESLQELIFIRQNTRVLIQYARQDGETWTVRFVSGDDAVLEFQSIPVKLPFAKIYHRVPEEETVPDA